MIIVSHHAIVNIGNIYGTRSKIRNIFVYFWTLKNKGDEAIKYRIVPQNTERMVVLTIQDISFLNSCCSNNEIAINRFAEILYPIFNKFIPA